MTINPIEEAMNATAEVLVERVVAQAKVILGAVPIYMVGQYDMDYNDEYHYPSGDGDAINMNDIKLFLQLEDAEAYAKKRNASFKSEIMYSSVGEYQGFNDLVVQDACAKHFPATSEYSVTYAALIDAMEDAGESTDGIVPSMSVVIKLDSPFHG